MNTQTEEIKSKLDIIDLISEYIQLKQAGANWRANCPFHNEKTPSFMVSREKQIWHCFGCNEGGDIISFVQKIENIEFPEALRILAEKAGVKLIKSDPLITSQKSVILDINKLAADFFHKALLASNEAEIARSYLHKRNINPNTIETFYLGYAPDSWDMLLQLLKRRGFKDNDILLSGLIVRNDKGRYYDRFRQRLMFPIADHNGNTVGFTGRILDESKANQGGKYVNSPQTMIYNKSQLIYALDKAKAEIKNKDLAVVVEGNMDAIASHQAGIKNVIASSGTAFTLEQLKLIKRYTNNLAFAFDADLAGQNAADRGIDAALSLGLNIKIIQLPETINNIKIKDPDDCIKQGIDYWEKAIEDSISIMDYYFNKYLINYNPDDAHAKGQIAAKLLSQINRFPDKIEQDHWLKKLAEKLDVFEITLRDSLQKISGKKSFASSKIVFENHSTKSREEQLAEQCLAIIFKYPENIDYLINHLDVEMLPGFQPQDIYKQLIIYYNNNNTFNYSEFEKTLLSSNENLVNYLSTLLLLADKEFLNFDNNDIKKELINIIASLKKHYVFQKIKLVQNRLHQAEENNNREEISELTEAFHKLNFELGNIHDTL